MSQGTSQAKVHDVTRERLLALREAARAQAAAFRREEQRPWEIPESLEAESLWDIPRLHEGPWSREEIGLNYQQCLQSAAAMGTTGDLMSLKLQNEHNASEERAFRLRHAGVCRLLAHASGRRRGLGRGVTYPRIEEMIAQVIASGAVV